MRSNIKTTNIHPMFSSLSTTTSNNNNNNINNGQQRRNFHQTSFHYAQVSDGTIFFHSNQIKNESIN